MRCYFHLVNGSETIRDTEGLEIADLDQAYAETLEAVQILAKEEGEAHGTWAGWHLEVCDASGAVLFSLSLDQNSSLH